MNLLIFALFGIAISATAQENWNAPSRAQKVTDIIPGNSFKKISPENLFAERCKTIASQFKGETDYVKLADETPKDSEVKAYFPSTISPFARIRGVKVDMRSYNSESQLPPGKDKQSVNAFIHYCPLCGASMIQILFDPKQPYDAATTSCCKRKLYRKDFPEGYDLKPNKAVKMNYLDDSVRTLPATQFTDKNGTEWELFIENIFNQKYWIDSALNVVKYFNEYQKTGNPLYPYKTALILDLTADTYYALPISYHNEFLRNSDGRPFSRKDWEDSPRPVTLGKTHLGSWNRRTPVFNKGWINMSNEAIFVEAFAVMRHHPAFKYYSQQKYGDPDALEKKIATKLLREISLAYQSIFAQRLVSNYQDANFKNILLIGILLQNQMLIDFAAASQYLTLYNHHYSDGLNAEGAPNYMHMLYVYYPYMLQKNGWLEIEPDFVKENPFIRTVENRNNKLYSMRGLQFEFGDQHSRTNAGLSTDSAQVANNSKRPSENYPGCGLGVIRVGAPERRMETTLHYLRPSLHTKQDTLGISSTFDGFPIIRTGGYAPYWCNALNDIVDKINQVGLPAKGLYSNRSEDAWNSDLAGSPILQNTLTINEVGPNYGWRDRRGLTEMLTSRVNTGTNTIEAHFQVVEVDALKVYERARYLGKTGAITDVSDNRRALIGVECRDGRAYVVDIYSVSGGQRQALHYAFWGKRVKEQLPAVTSNFKDLAEAWQLPSKKELGNDSDTLRHAYENAKKIRTHEKQQGSWSVTVENDYYDYIRDENGIIQRPKNQNNNIGKSAMQLISIVPDGKTEIVSGKAAWTAMIIYQKLKSGETLHGITVPFEDAFDLFIQKRTADGKNKLSSKFISLFAANFINEPQTLVNAAALPVKSGDTAKIAAIETETVNKDKDIIIANNTDGVITLENGLVTNARFAMVRRDAGNNIIEAHLVGGTHLKYQGQEFKAAAASYDGEIADIIGDITGTRQEAALIIKPSGNWDLSGLTNEFITVTITRPTNFSNLESYKIAKATKLPNGNIRLDIDGIPPFAVGWHQISEFDSANPAMFRTNRPLRTFLKVPWYEGATAWFPAQNKKYVIKDTGPSASPGDDREIYFDEKVNLQKDGLKIGDWCMIYAIQPGQKTKITLSKSFSGSNN